MSQVRSHDGTSIAFERSGSGFPIILVDGALCYRDSGPMRPLSELLARHFTVYIYDRRGRGQSGDTAPYAVEREVEDIAALLAEAGGEAHLYGSSSGALLALEAASRLPGVRRLAMYEAPLIVDDTHAPRPDDFVARMDDLVAEGRMSDAVKMFMKTVGVPGFVIAVMRLLPVWRKLSGVAHTLPYDFRVLGDTGRGRPLPAGRWKGATGPALAIDGGKSEVWMRNGMRALAGVLPNASYRTLEGQNHVVKPAALAPVLVEFFSAD